MSRPAVFPIPVLIKASVCGQCRQQSLPTVRFAGGLVCSAQCATRFSRSRRPRCGFAAPGHQRCDTPCPCRAGAIPPCDPKDMTWIAKPATTVIQTPAPSIGDLLKCAPAVFATTLFPAPSPNDRIISAGPQHLRFAKQAIQPRFQRPTVSPAFAPAIQDARR
jgi:hypothetical protein